MHMLVYIVLRHMNTLYAVCVHARGFIFKQLMWARNNMTTFVIHFHNLNIDEHWRQVVTMPKPKKNSHRILSDAK